MLRPLLIAAVAAFLASPVLANNLKFDATNKNGAVVFETEPSFRPYSLVIWKFMPEEGKFSSNPVGSGLVGFSSFGGAGQRGRQFHLARYPAGIYAVREVTHLSWGACFNGGTLKFEVKPGQVNFIGRLDPNPSLGEVIDAARSGKFPTSARRSSRYFVFDTPRPALTAPSALPDWQAELTTWLGTEYPNVTAPLVAADLSPAAFGLGRDAFGSQKLCGGYYASGVPQPTAPAP